MIIKTTTTGRTHNITDLTDDQLLVIEAALYQSETDVGDATNYVVWEHVNEAVHKHELTPVREPVE